VFLFCLVYFVFRFSYLSLCRIPSSEFLNIWSCFQDEQYTELDKQLKLVEELRFENRVKEREMAANIRQQQEARFRNLQQSIAQGIVDDDA